MRNFLESRLGREIEINCGSITVIGKVAKVEGEVAWLEKDGTTCYVNIDKIIAVWDLQDKKAQRPGFIVESK